MSFGGIFGPTTEADSLHTLDAAWEAGITLFDTANIYGYGQSEEIIAEMARLVRPGGVVALHEADSTTQRIDPPSTLRLSASRA